MKLPLFNHFKASTFNKAFLLNAIIGAIICALAIELRFSLEKDSNEYYGFWSNIYGEKKLTQLHKFFGTFLTTFIVSILVYYLMYILFHYGGGQLNLIKNDSGGLKDLFKER